MIKKTDDTKLWEIALKHLEIQQDILQVGTWVDDNNMMVNCGKYNRVHIAEKSGGQYEPYLANNNEEIQDKEHVKDLGIFISSNFSFDYHIANMVGQGEVVAAWILSNKRSIPHDDTTQAAVGAYTGVWVCSLESQQ